MFDYTFSDLSWSGTHVLEIEGCLGDGVVATYNNCASTQWTIVISNPCETANFVIAYPVNSLSTSVGSDSIGTQYEIPTDSVSTLYGNGYNKCGDRIHYLQSSTGSKIYPVIGDSSATTFQADMQFPFIEFLSFPGGDPNGGSSTPVYQINVKTDSDAYYGFHPFTLHFEFVDYPSSTANTASSPLDIQIDPCNVESYLAPGDLSTQYQIGTPEQTIFFSFSQYPCTYGATYTAELIRRGVDLDNLEDSNDSLPAFIV